MPDAAEHNDLTGLGALANPYDFAKPVTRPDRFAGRQNELEDIKYYLRLAKQTPEPMNLAVIGERASGKTSMLNIIDIEAKKIGLVTARINLNSADAEPINFFWKLYDALVDAYSITGHLFKPGSDEDVVYRRIVDSLDPAADSPNFPLRFPTHYAMAAKGSRQISEVKLQRDLTYIYEYSRTPCILIFDECNIMTQNRVTLEMLRNVFMNISGYMIVLTGTPSFFPLMDDVFSPIIRQFKKINIKAFNDLDETRQCVFNPIRSLLLNPSALVSHEALFDIHAISRGRPYEIQLLCHFMFRRLQDQRATEMELTADTMDDVLNELEATISGAVERPIVTAVRKMTKKQLAAVSVFGRADDYTDSDLAWFINVISSSAHQFTRDELTQLLDELKALGVFQVNEDNIIKFAGDDFDRIYLRYHAERLGLSVYIDDYPGPLALTFVLGQTLGEIGVNTEFEFPQRPSLEKVVSALLAAPKGELPETTFSAVRPVITSMDQGRLVVARVEISYRDERAYASVWWPFRAGYSFTDDPKYLKFKDTVESSDGTISTETFIFDLPAEEEFIATVLSSPNKKLKQRIGDFLAELAAEEYMADNDSAALVQARQASLFKLKSEDLNNIGYIFMALGQCSDAEMMTRRSAVQAEKEEDFKIAALALYNSAMCKLLNHQREDTVATLSQARQMLSADPDGIYNLRCLFVPVIAGRTLTLKEMWEPELSASIDAAMAALEASPESESVEIVRRRFDSFSH